MFGAADFLVVGGVCFLKWGRRAPSAYCERHVTAARLLTMAWAGVDFCLDLGPSREVLLLLLLLLLSSLAVRLLTYFCFPFFLLLFLPPCAVGIGELQGAWKPLGLVCLGVSLGVNVLAIAVVLRWGRMTPDPRHQLDKREMDRMSQLVAFVLFVTATNLDGLALLPWKSRQFNGFPAQRVIMLTAFAACLENVSQLVIQVLNGRDAGELSTVALVTISCSAISIAVQVLRKFVVGAFVDEAADGGGGGGLLRAFSRQRSTASAAVAPAATGPATGPAVAEPAVLAATPAPVVMDEAVQLARRYGTDASPAFVNGILDAIASGGS